MNTRPSPQIGRTQLILLIVLGSVTAIQPLSRDMYLPGLPAIGRDLHASLAGTQLTVAIFFIGTALGQLLFGPISDRFGRRWPALVGMTLYIASTLGCGLAANIESLVVLRFLQAIGVCAGQVVARAMLADLYEPRELARFSSLLTMITLVAPIFAPLLGGFVLTHFGWRALFVVLALYGLVVASLIAGRMPETRSHAARALSRGESLLAGYVAILGNWPLMRMGLITACASAGFFIYLAGSPHLIIEHYGVPAGLFGVYFAANSVGVFVGSNINRTLLHKRSPDSILMVTCWAYLAFALLLLAGAMWPVAGQWTVLVPLVLIVSVFPTVVINSTAVAQGLDRQRGGAVAAVLGAVQALIGAGSITLAGTLGDGSPTSLALGIVAAAGVTLALFLMPGRRRPAAQ